MDALRLSYLIRVLPVVFCKTIGVNYAESKIVSYLIRRQWPLYEHTCSLLRHGRFESNWGCFCSCPPAKRSRARNYCLRDSGQIRGTISAPFSRSLRSFLWRLSPAASIPRPVGEEDACWPDTPRSIEVGVRGQEDPLRPLLSRMLDSRKGFYLVFSSFFGHNALKKGLDCKSVWISEMLAAVVTQDSPPWKSVFLWGPNLQIRFCGMSILNALNSQERGGEKTGNKLLEEPNIYSTARGQKGERLRPFLGRNVYSVCENTHWESTIAGLETACIPLYGDKIYGSASRSIESPMSGLAQCQAPRFRERIGGICRSGKKATWFWPNGSNRENARKK